MKDVSHQAILASAGSGKTFQLAQRYLRLLALDVDPARIVALTFSRKAAGEIFESVVQALSRAAGDADEAAKAAGRLDEPGLGASEFRDMLRRLLNRLHRLRIGTLDSFSVGVMRAFPFELGLSTDPQLMDSGGAGAAAARRDALHRIYDRGLTDEDSQQQFFEAFKLSTFGQEAKGMTRLLDRFIGEQHELFQCRPDLDRWGAPGAIWPGEPPGLEARPDVGEAADRLLALIDQSGWSPYVRSKWTAFAADARVHTVGSGWPKGIDYLLPRLLDQFDALQGGRAEIKINKQTCELDAAACAALLPLVSHVWAVELAGSLARTQGQARLLAVFDGVYEESVRRQGRLTFHDVQVMLSRWRPALGLDDRAQAAQTVRRLLIDERLDAQLDHWLLDEFQDTSNLQWSVLENLVDEVMQDPSGRRSFFFVGDVKQAIYGWRGGNPFLFRRIQERYRGALEQRALATSFRSAQPVIDCVNQVFSDLPRAQLSEAAVESWNTFWVSHQVQPGAVPSVGYAALLEPPNQDGRTKPDSADRLALTAALLNELRPMDHGWSVGILVRTNDQGFEAANALRRLCPEIAVAHEGATQILDTPVTLLLASLIKAAFHPGDSCAWRHLAMSPLEPAVRALGRTASERTRRLLGPLFESGFQSFVADWGAKLDAAAPLDAFGRRRWRDLWEAAGAYDETRGCDGSEFLEWLDAYTVQEPAAEFGARVMTIHQSKGLGFDVVILPELNGRISVGGGGEVGVVAAEDRAGHIRWLLDMPRRMVAERDQVLAAELDRVDRDRCFEALCVLYVALTRARRALYLVTSFPGKQAKLFNEAALVKQQLTGDPKAPPGRPVEINGQSATLLWECGSARWHQESAAAQRPPPRPKAATPAGRPAPARSERLRSISPSTVDAQPENAGALFEPRRYQILELGTAVHALFEELDWFEDDTDPASVAAAWRRVSPFEPAVTDEAIRAFRTACAAESIRRALRRPGGVHVDLWREKRFEAIVDDEWVTGTFDRVVIHLNDAGVPRAAVIQDFKTNEIQSPEHLRQTADHYRPQLQLYQCALSAILDIPASAIALELLFTRPGQALRL